MWEDFDEDVNYLQSILTDRTSIKDSKSVRTVGVIDTIKENELVINKLNTFNEEINSSYDLSDFEIPTEPLVESEE